MGELTTLDLDSDLANVGGVDDEIAQQANDEISSGFGSAIPRLRLTNMGRFEAVKGEQSQILDEPPQVIILAIAPKNQRVFYHDAFSKGDSNPPDCFSSDNERPHPNASDPQSTACATCKQNRKGASTGDDGREGRACSYRRNMVIMNVEDLPKVLADDPEDQPELSLFSINGGGLFGESYPAEGCYSFKGYRDYLIPSPPRPKFPKGIPYCYVITRLTQDENEEVAKPLFSLVNFVPGNVAKVGRALWDFSRSDAVTNIMAVALNANPDLGRGDVNTDMGEGAAPDDDDDDDDAAEATKLAAKKKAAKAKAAKAKAEKEAAEAAAAEAEDETGTWYEWALEQDVDPADIEVIALLGGPNSEKGEGMWDRLVGLEIPEGVDQDAMPADEPAPAKATKPKPKPKPKATSKAKPPKPKDLDDEGSGSSGNVADQVQDFADNI